MRKCSFCANMLPERGFTHYMMVETRAAGVVPCCNACRRRLNLKMVDLRKDES